MFRVTRVMGALAAPFQSGRIGFAEPGGYDRLGSGEAFVVWLVKLIAAALGALGFGVLAGMQSFGFFSQDLAGNIPGIPVFLLVTGLLTFLAIGCSAAVVVLLDEAARKRRAKQTEAA